MPELPEVHTISTDLNKHIKGAKILRIDFFENYKVFPDNQTFVEKLQNKKIKDVSRIAKNIVFELEDATIFTIHLAMTGRIFIRTSEKLDRWQKISIKLVKNGKTAHLRFCDMRMFGKVKFLSENEILHLKTRYGPEVIDENLTYETFHNQIKSKKTNIKNALLDQEIVSGLGNIYATDTLFISKIHPLTQTKDLTFEHSKILLDAAREILKEAISNRGSTLEDKMYVDIFGKPGNHQNFFRIYSKKICPTCNSKTTFEKINGRGTFYCSNCQIKIDKTNSNAQRLI